MEKLLPQNIEAECGVLGSIIIDPEAIVQVADFLQSDDFYRDAHRTIFEVIIQLYEQREAADFITICDELERQGKLETVGGASYITSLINQVPTSGNVEYYGRIVERNAILRRLIHAAGQIAAIAYDESDADVALDKAEQLIFNISQNHARTDFSLLRDLLSDYQEKLNQLHERRGLIVGVPTGFTDLDRLTGGLQKSDLIILAARPAVGKCLPAWTLIDHPVTGERLTIEEYVRRRVPVVHNVSEDGKIQVTEISDWVDSGVQPCYRVQTRLGRIVEVTGHHPFLTIHGWRPLHDLKVGQHIAVPTHLDCFGQDESWPIEKVRLLAYFIAESGLTHTTPVFTNTDPLIIEDFKQIIATYFPALHIRQHGIDYAVAQPKNAETMEGRGGIFPKNPITVWLTELGLMGKLAKKKCFPACVWTWSKRYLAEFLRALMSCDGSIYAVASLPERPLIEFTVASQQLAADVCHALLRFGIVGKYHRTTYNAWRVHITSAEDVKKYQEQIGWIGEKCTRFANSTYVGQLKIRNIRDAPVATWELVRAASREQGLSLTELVRKSGETEKVGKYAGYNSHTNRTIPSRRLAAYAEVLDNTALRRIGSPDIYWDEIVSIEAIGEHHVYDLTVPNGANFIAQDVFVHNTSLALSLAHNSAIKHQRSVAIFSLEMSKEQLVQRLLSMDAGVDQQRLRTGWIEDDEWERIVYAMGTLSEANIWIDDTAGISTVEMRSKSRRLQAEHGIDLIIVDYLQLMQSTVGGKRNENRVQEISEVSRNLKVLARELDVPVLALAQLSRAVESRQSKVPQLSDLRESGCLTGDSLIYLPDQGTYVRLDSLVGQREFHVLALNAETWQLEPCTVSKAFSTGYKPVYRLKTCLGRTIRATANHKFLTIKGWQRLDELSSGDRVAMPRRLPDVAQATMKNEELALLGHLIGDGCTLPRHAVQYTTVDQDLAELVAQLAKQVFGEAVVPRINWETRKGANGGWYQVYLAAGYRLTHNVRNPIAIWLSTMGIYGLRSYEKYVPSMVFMQSNEGIATFLRHLWATDGTASVTTNRPIPTIMYATSSLKLACDIQSLLLRLDINAGIVRSPQVGKGRDQYHVDISGKPDQELFITKVGLVGMRKKRMLENIKIYLAPLVTNTNRDVLPREVWRIFAVPAMQVAGLTSRQMQAALGNAYCGTGLYKQNISRERAARLAQVVECDQLASLAQSDVYWDKIIAIEPDGEEEVYDLTVDELHNFVANNIIVHNSIEQDSDLVMFIYRDDVYNPESERKNIADIIVAKHRNGPVGEVSLYFQANQTRFSDLEANPPSE